MNTQPSRFFRRQPSRTPERSVVVWEYQCPVDGCEFSAGGNDEDELVEAARQHVGDAHGDTPTRDEVEGYLVGRG